MSLDTNGGLLLDNIDTVIVNGVAVTEVVANGVSVWVKYAGPPSPITITTTQTLTAGVDFPANTELTVCLVGGGASGSKLVATQCYGGYAGVVSTEVVAPIILGTDVLATVGSGGSPVGLGVGNGNSGGSSSFSTAIVSGGTNGATSGGQTTCGGTGVGGANVQFYVHGNYFGYGGQSSGFSNGGDAKIDSPSAGSGGVGSGGGALTIKNGSPVSYSGAGGRGEIRISWS